jgi:hypothetical protein
MLKSYSSIQQTNVVKWNIVKNYKLQIINNK